MTKGTQKENPIHRLSSLVSKSEYFDDTNPDHAKLKAELAQMNNPLVQTLLSRWHGGEPR